MKGNSESSYRTGSVNLTAANIGAAPITAITNIKRSGTTFTATRASGDTFTFTQQDNNTTYSNATTSTAGLMSASDKIKLDNIGGVYTDARSVSVLYASDSAFTSLAGLVVLPGTYLATAHIYAGKPTETATNHITFSQFYIDNVAQAVGTVKCSTTQQGEHQMALCSIVVITAQTNLWAQVRSNTNRGASNGDIAIMKIN